MHIESFKTAITDLNPDTQGAVLTSLAERVGRQLPPDGGERAVQEDHTADPPAIEEMIKQWWSAEFRRELMFGDSELNGNVTVELNL